MSNLPIYQLVIRSKNRSSGTADNYTIQIGNVVPALHGKNGPQRFHCKVDYIAFDSITDVDGIIRASDSGEVFMLDVSCSINASQGYDTCNSGIANIGFVIAPYQVPPSGGFNSLSFHRVFEAQNVNGSLVSVQITDIAKSALKNVPNHVIAFSLTPYSYDAPSI